MGKTKPLCALEETKIKKKYLGTKICDFSSFFFYFAFQFSFDLFFDPFDYISTFVPKLKKS